MSDETPMTTQLMIYLRSSHITKDLRKLMEPLQGIVRHLTL